MARKRRRVSPREADWYAHAVIGRDVDDGTETSEVDGYFAGAKPARGVFLPLPDGWKIIEFSARRTAS